MVGGQYPTRSKSGRILRLAVCLVLPTVGFSGCGFGGQPLDISPEDRAAVDVTDRSLSELNFVELALPRLGSQYGVHNPRSPGEGQFAWTWTFQFQRDIGVRNRHTAEALLELAGYPLAGETPDSAAVFTLGGELVYFDVETREGYARDTVLMSMGIRWDLMDATGDTVFTHEVWNDLGEPMFSDRYGSILSAVNRLFLADMLALLRTEGFRAALARESE